MRDIWFAAEHYGHSPLPQPIISSNWGIFTELGLLDRSERLYYEYKRFASSTTFIDLRVSDLSLDDSCSRHFWEERDLIARVVIDVLSL
ncbi:unnamed protein product [Hymenolepis diminuta]|uniref:Uncharacterized protein n=1 Tax=Hymenolepis diminuta TaxID=6216 RepID=A0A564YCX5_HYMDI|nr:unnamed protein product [Hymenolepis diminuta]